MYIPTIAKRHTCLYTWSTFECGKNIAKGVWYSNKFFILQYFAHQREYFAKSTFPFWYGIKFDEIGAENKLLGTQVEFISTDINHCVQGGRGGKWRDQVNIIWCFGAITQRNLTMLGKSQIVRNIQFDDYIKVLCCVWLGIKYIVFLVGWTWYAFRSWTCFE